MSAEPTRAAEDFAEHLRALDRDGVIVINGVFSTERLAAFKAEHDRLFEKVQSEIKTLPLEDREYITKFDTKLYNTKQCYNHSDGTQTIMLAEGRYDFGLGMDGPVFKEHLMEKDAMHSRLVEHKLVSDWDWYAGALPSTAKADPGQWHRDTYPLFDDDSIDIKLPPFYFNVLVPLVPINPENGATNFLKGSHKQTYEQLKESNPKLEYWQPECIEPGSVVLFDGRIFHRGGPNFSADERTVLYMVCHKKWYNDY